MHLKTSFKIHEAKLVKLKRDMGKFTIIFGRFNIPVSVINRTSRQKSAKI